VKHSAEENSIKMYDKQARVLRVETTLNHPQRFRVYRRVTRRGRRVKGWYALRKGIVDLRRRLQSRRAANLRYLEALAVVGESRPSHRILDPVSQPVREPRPYRALRPVSPEDSRWSTVLLRGEFQLQGVISPRAMTMAGKEISRGRRGLRACLGDRGHGARAGRARIKGVWYSARTACTLEGSDSP